MSKLVFTILCAVGVLLWTKWKQDNNFFNKFFKKFFGDGGSPPFDRTTNESKGNQQSWQGAYSGLDVIRARKRPVSFSAGSELQDPDDDYRRGREPADRRNKDNARVRHPSRDGALRHEDTVHGPGEHRQGREDGRGRGANGEGRGGEFDLDDLAPDMKKPPHDPGDGSVPIREGRERKKRKKEKNSRGDRSPAHSLNEKTGRGDEDDDRKGRRRKQSGRIERTESEEERAVLEEARRRRERPGRLTKEEELEKRLRFLEREEEDKEFERRRARRMWGSEDPGSTRGQAQGDRYDDRVPLRRQGPPQRGGPEGQEYYEGRGGGYAGAAGGEGRGDPYGSRQYQGRPPMMQQGGGQYGSEGYGSYSERRPGYPGGQLADQSGYPGGGYRGQGGAQLNDPGAVIRDPSEYVNQNGYARQGRDGLYRDRQGRIVQHRSDSGYYNDPNRGESVNDIEGSGKSGASDRQQQSRIEEIERRADAAEERRRLIAQVREIRKEKEAERLREESQATERGETIRLADISTSKAHQSTKEHWAERAADGNSATKDHTDSHQADKPSAPTHSAKAPSERHSADHHHENLSLADLPPDSKDSRLKNHKAKEHRDETTGVHHSSHPATTEHHVSYSTAGLTLNDVPPSPKDKLPAADATRQQWAAKHPKSSKKGSAVDTSVPGPLPTTSAPFSIPVSQSLPQKKESKESASKAQPETPEPAIQLNNTSSDHFERGPSGKGNSSKQHGEVPLSHHEVPVKVPKHSKPVSIEPDLNSTSIPTGMESTLSRPERPPFYDKVYRGAADPNPGLPPLYSENLDPDHDQKTLQKPHWDVEGANTSENITLNNVAPASFRGGQQATNSKPSSSSGRDGEPERNYPKEKERVYKNEITPRGKIPDELFSGRMNQPEQTSIPPIAVAQVQIQNDHPDPSSVPYGSKQREMDIVDANRLQQEPPSVRPTSSEIHLQDAESGSHKETRLKPTTSKTDPTFRFQSETSDSLKHSVKSLCRNAKTCKKRTISFIVLSAAYIAATYYGSSLLIAQAPAAVAASVVVKRQEVASTATDFAADAITSVNDAFQKPGLLMGMLQGHALLISMLWHLVAQVIIVALINSIYSFEPSEAKPNDETPGSSKTASADGKGSSTSVTSWKINTSWKSICNRVTRTRDWFHRNMGRWSCARYGMILALFLISLIVGRQLTSLAYISRNPSSAEPPWSTFPDVTLFYGKLRASRAGLATGVSLVQVSMCFWVVVVFSASYCMSTLGDPPATRVADLEQGKAVA